MAGPNGRGKTCVFDAFQAWQGQRGRSFSLDVTYHLRDGEGNSLGPDAVIIEFHEEVPERRDLRAMIFYVRSAYRNQADFTSHSLERQPPLWEKPVQRLIEDEVRVSENYARLVSSTVAEAYSRDHDEETIKELRDRHLSQVGAAMTRLFGDLVFVGPGDPLLEGTFFFEKGLSKNFRYKNLSGGEKAAFDLLLDMTVAAKDYKNSVFCIDEPELHLSTRLQAQLLEELLRVVPVGSQLWIATHSLGMFSKAKDLAIADPSSVAILDFDCVGDDGRATLSPVSMTRAFWRKTLHVALDDLANLVAPGQVILCEGSAKSPGDGFDASCYAAIFGAAFPDTDFMSIGSSVRLFR